MNLSPDPRQLKTRVSLSVLNAPESGFFSGEYSASTATKSQDNLNVLNYDFESTYTYDNGNTERKYSPRLKVISSLQNARIPEVNTVISASSCTFAYGAIVPGEVDPVLNRLKGPKVAYNPNFIDDPIQGTVSSQLGKINQEVPKIPFSDEGNVLTTYNIWQIASDGAVITDDADAYKYIGPAIKDTNTGTLRTVKDQVYGAQVEVTSIQKLTTVMRIFPTSYDAVYQNGAELYNPDGTIQPILATGNNGGNSFHLNLSFSNMQENSSICSLYLMPAGPINEDFINKFIINFEIDKKPVLEIYDPQSKKYLVQTDLIAPVLDKNNMSSYDVFVHFVGPNMMIGFSSDITKWNTVINFSGREVYFPPETYISLQVKNLNLKLRYSALIFNNYNESQPESRKKNYITAEFRYSGKKVKDLLGFLGIVKKSFDAAEYRINDSPRNTGYNRGNPDDKNISYFADLRLSGNQFEDIKEVYAPAGKSADADKKTVYFKIIYNTTIEGPAFMQVEIPHPGTLASFPNIVNLDNQTGASGYKFVNPTTNGLLFEVGDVTAWVEDWSVECNTESSNMSVIQKKASIKLKNIDSLEGQKFINAIENNLLVVTIDAGYLDGKLQCFFQGFITNTSYSRTGNDSTFTLNCMDIGTFILSNLYFDKNMMLAGMRHDLAIDSIIAASGFWSYYLRSNKDNANNSIITGMDLRLNSNSVNNQDLIKLNPLDKILEKLNKLLERLNNPYSLPTFRWAEKSGFILECRNNYVDSDLRFTALNAAGTGYTFGSNASNQNKNYLQNFQTDIHGLLQGEYTISTNIQGLAAGVRVFGVSMTGFLADERYTENSVTNPAFLLLPPEKKLLYLANAPVDTSQAPYIGFKKYLIWATQRNEIPDQTILKRVTDSIEVVSKIPISSVSFTCYVSKPLTYHGKFKINVFQGKIANFTDEYVYQSIDYKYDKMNNLITAFVRGINLPVTL